MLVINIGLLIIIIDAAGMTLSSRAFPFFSSRKTKSELPVSGWSTESERERDREIERERERER